MKINAHCYALIIGCLMDRPHSTKEMAEVSGLHVQTARDYVNALYNIKRVHIADWDQDNRGRDCIPMFLMGRAKDKPRHRRTKQEIGARYRKNRAARLAQAALTLTPAA